MQKQNLLKTLFLIGFFIFLISFFGCGDDDDPKPVEKIELSNSSLILQVDQEIQLMATARDVDGDQIDGVIFSWASSDTTTLKVSSDGLVSALSTGEANISASAENISSLPCSVLVDGIHWIILNGAAMSLEVGQTQQMTAIAKNVVGDILDADFSWISSDTSVANFNQSGLLTAISCGTTIINAISGNVVSVPWEIKTTPAMTHAKIDVGGHELYYYFGGEGSPTVIFEAGWADWSKAWSKITPEVAESARIVAYDRAGHGQSDEGPLPRHGLQIAEELHTMLENAEIDPPYVIVGHSLGGLYVRLFAHQYPDEVVGMVLVDASHEGYATLRDKWDEWEVVEVTCQQVRQARLNDPLSEDMSLFVITAGLSSGAHIELQRDLVTLVPNGVHVIATESDHAIPQRQPQIVIDVIQQVIETKL